MIYIVIGIILLLVIAPVIAILPGAAQKERMAKRKAAMARGIGVELTKIDDPDPDPEKYLSTTGQPLERKMSVAAYRLQRKRHDSWRSEPYPKWGVNRVSSQQGGDPQVGWQWSESLEADAPEELKRFVESNLGRLAEDIIRVEEKNLVISVYWNEDGDVQETIDFLESCASVEVSRPDLDGRADDDNST